MNVGKIGFGLYGEVGGWEEWLRPLGPVSVILLFENALRPHIVNTCRDMAPQALLLGRRWVEDSAGNPQQTRWIEDANPAQRGREYAQWLLQEHGYLNLDGWQSLNETVSSSHPEKSVGTAAFDYGFAEVMLAAGRRPMLLNAPPGNPQPEDILLWEPAIRLSPSQVILDYHGYAFPDEGEYPSPPGHPEWHELRYRQMVDLLRTHNIPVPEWVIGECSVAWKRHSGSSPATSGMDWYLTRLNEDHYMRGCVPFQWGGNPQWDPHRLEDNNASEVYGNFNRSRLVSRDSIGPEIPDGTAPAPTPTPTPPTGDSMNLGDLYNHVSELHEQLVGDNPVPALIRAAVQMGFHHLGHEFDLRLHWRGQERNTRILPCYGKKYTLAEVGDWGNVYYVDDLGMAWDPRPVPNP
jgi:hypothetical protein